MTSVEDPRFIAAMTVLGACVAILKGPLLLTFLAAILLSVLLLPYFILNPSVTLKQSLNLGTFKATFSIFQGNSNLPRGRFTCLAAALVVSACVYALFGQILIEAIVPRLTSIELVDRNGMNQAILAAVLYMLFQSIKWYAKKLA